MPEEPWAEDEAGWPGPLGANFEVEGMGLTTGVEFDKPPLELE